MPFSEEEDERHTTTTTTTSNNDDNENCKRQQYYTSTRFEHGSMIGDITYHHGSHQQQQSSTMIYGHDQWRAPHNPTNPESGIGLASEFGCGNNGSTCNGYHVTNGVLGYESAKVGEPFLKIGVGSLIKGSCDDCGSSSGSSNNNKNSNDDEYNENDEEYKFNSRYKFHNEPKWKVLPSPDPNEVTFVHEETLHNKNNNADELYGYRIQKTIRLDGTVLTVRSILTNLGTKQFTTPWYSHHFFSGNNNTTDPIIRPGYVLDLGISQYGLPTPLTPQFDQPGLDSWSGNINDYANVTMAHDGSISISITKAIPEGTKLKANFLDVNKNTQTYLTDGSFTLHAPNGQYSVYEKIPELQTQSRNPFIYAYNIYVERSTLSPEPMLLLYLEPGETTFWTQHLKFTSSDVDDGTSDLVGSRDDDGASLFWGMSIWSMLPTTSNVWKSPAVNLSDPTGYAAFFAVLVAACCLSLAAAAVTLYRIRYTGGSILSSSSSSRQTRRSDYSSIPDCSAESEEKVADGGGDVVISVV